MSAEPLDARVPRRVVILSICGLWLCYFVLVTLRSVIIGFDFSVDFLARRLMVTLASIAVTLMLWPPLQTLDARPLWTRAMAILIGAIPAALLLSAVNSWAFAGVDAMVVGAPADSLKKGSVPNGGIRVRDEAGNVLVDIAPPAPPAPPEPGESGGGGGKRESRRTAKGTSTSTAASPGGVTIVKRSHTSLGSYWDEPIDVVLSRYFILIAWAALYAALANGEQLRAAERREGALRRAATAAELRSLRYQVNPHFLFNTLNSLSALVMTGKLDAAETMIQTLSTFYRRTLSSDPTGDLPLADEIELQQLYLDIEAVRFPGRVLRRVELPVGLGDALVPGMILQPLVENSVKYAVASTPEPVTISIIVSEDWGRLVVSVCDDGAGVDRALPGRPGLGVGLSNVRDRLSARFGTDASLDAGPLLGGGFRTMIRMPLVRTGEGGADGGGRDGGGGTFPGDRDAGEDADDG